MRDRSEVRSLYVANSMYLPHLAEAISGEAQIRPVGCQGHMKRTDICSDREGRANTSRLMLARQNKGSYLISVQAVSHHVHHLPDVLVICVFRKGNSIPLIRGL